MHKKEPWSAGKNPYDVCQGSFFNSAYSAADSLSVSVSSSATLKEVSIANAVFLKSSSSVGAQLMV